MKSAQAMKATGKPSKRGLETSGLPTYCDFACPHASFASNDVVGACRRDLAVYCSLLASFNNKNSRCPVRKIAFD